MNKISVVRFVLVYFDESKNGTIITLHKGGNYDIKKGMLKCLA